MMDATEMGKIVAAQIPGGLVTVELVHIKRACIADAIQAKTMTTVIIRANLACAVIPVGMAFAIQVLTSLISIVNVISFIKSG